MGLAKMKMLLKKMIRRLKIKQHDVKNEAESIGTTPRHLTDIGSLCDLTSGSGVLIGNSDSIIQGYFDNYGNS